jgi:hypothetical protein
MDGDGEASIHYETILVTHSGVVKEARRHAALYTPIG